MWTFSTRISAIATAAAIATAVWQASSVAASILPAGKAAFADESVNFARGMIGRDLHAVDWAVVPLERSPADPENPDSDGVLAKRLVYNPPVTEPTAFSQWTAGQMYTVRWEVDIDNVPEAVKDYTGAIYLGYLPEDGAGGENLKWELASGFPITSGKQNVTLPSDLETRDDYIIVVMGDSGNRSKKFRINAADDIYGKKTKHHKKPSPMSKPESSSSDSEPKDQGPSKDKPKPKQESQPQPQGRGLNSKGMLGRDIHVV